MAERATLPDDPTQEDMTAVAKENGEAHFNSPTDPEFAPVKDHRDAHAEGGEYADAETYDEDDDEVTKDELQEAARSRGLAVSGTKAELRDRIDAHDRENA